MVLEKDKIIANTKKYFDTANKNGFMTEELMKFLGEDFIKAPATNTKGQYNCFEGGLIEHLLRVAFYAVKFNNALPDNEKVDQTSLLKVCLLHQIGRARLFVPCDSEWHRTNQGKLYEYNDSIVSMRVSDRSIYYAMSHGITFTEEEYIAINNYDKPEDKMAEFFNSTLGELLKMGNTFAIKHSKKNY
jgi:hypothetical protein